MRQKARQTTLHGGPPGWLEKNDPAKWCFRGRLYSLTEPRAAKSVIESKHQLRGMPGR